MIHIEKVLWEGIPILIIANEKKELPVITYFHGFTGSKEDNLALAYLLAEKGFRVLLPDALLHGERINEVDPVERQVRFLEIVQQNLVDLEVIKSHLETRGWLTEKRFGLAGTSMGGIATAAALTKYPWIKAAAVLMGSAKLSEFAQDLVAGAKAEGLDLPVTEVELAQLFVQLKELDLSLHLERLQERPIFIWHGEEDPVVPFAHAQDFYQKVVNDYQDPDQIRFLSERETGHKVSRLARLEVVDWFAKQL